MFGIAKLTAVFLTVSVVLALARSGSRDEYYRAIKLTRTPAGSSARDFLVYVTTGKNRHQWKLPFLLDTGSWDVWVEADSVTSSKNNGLRGYINLHLSEAVAGPKILTYAYGHSVELDYAVNETLDFGSGVKAKLRLWISNKVSPAFFNSFGSVGTIGAEISSEFAHRIGQFYLVPKIGRMEMIVGSQRVNDLCHRKKLHYSSISRSSTSYDRWNVEGSFGVHSQISGVQSVPNESVAVKLHITMDTGHPGIELITPLWNAMTSIMNDIGSPIYEANGSIFATNCDSYRDRFPKFSVSIGSFIHYIHPRAYIIRHGSECVLKLYHKSSSMSPPQMFLGASFLRYVISHWDAKGFRMGFCKIRKGVFTA